MLDLLAQQEELTLVGTEVTLRRFGTGDKSRWSDAENELIDSYTQLYLDASHQHDTLDEVLCMFSSAGHKAQDLMKEKTLKISISGNNQTHSRRPQDLNPSLSHEDALFMHTCNVLINDMRFDPEQVHEMLIKKWHIVQGDIARAIAFLVDIEEEEEEVTGNMHQRSVAMTEEMKSRIDERVNRESSLITVTSDNNIPQEEINQNENQQNDVNLN